SYGWGAVEWGLVNRYWPIAPHIHLEDGFGPEESETVQLRRRVYLRRIAFGQHTRIIVPSRTLWNVATNYWKVAPSRLSLIPNGIDCQRFSPKKDKKPLIELGVDQGGVVIGTVAALRPEKNLARLITAFAQLAKEITAHLVIAGEGPERIRLQSI